MKEGEGQGAKVAERVGSKGQGKEGKGKAFKMTLQ